VKDLSAKKGAGLDAPSRHPRVRHDVGRRCSRLSRTIGLGERAPDSGEDYASPWTPPTVGPSSKAPSAGEPHFTESLAGSVTRVAEGPGHSRGGAMDQSALWSRLAAVTTLFPFPVMLVYHQTMIDLARATV